MLVNGFGASSYRSRAHRNGPDGETQHRGRLRRRGKRVPCFGQRAMHACERPWNIQSVAGRLQLGLHADGTYPGRQVRQFVRNGHEFDVKLFVFYAFKHLVIPIQASVKTVVGAPP